MHPSAYIFLIGLPMLVVLAQLRSRDPNTSALAQFHSRDPNTFAQRLSRAKRILDEVPLVDGHNDLASNIREVVHNQLDQFPFEDDLTQLDPWSSRATCHTDLPRIREGKLGAQFWSAWVPCNSQYKNAVTHTLEQIDVIRRLVDRYPQDLAWATTSDDIIAGHASGRVASLIGLEGGHSMDVSLATLRTFYDRGARYMTLTHTCNTPWADNAGAERDGTEEFDGLSPWGEIVVKEMNRLGMIVDIAHVASQTMHDVLDITRAPIIASHSDTKALYDTTRNVPDDVLLRMHDNGGVIMVTFVPFYLNGRINATVHDVIDHINHVRNVAGVDHVGIGSDFDGIPVTPYGLEDVSKYPNLFAELMLDPLWTEEDLKKLAGLNIIRAFREVEQVRASLVSESPWDTPIPMEDMEGRLNCTNIWPEEE